MSSPKFRKRWITSEVGGSEISILIAALIVRDMLPNDQLTDGGPSVMASIADRVAGPPPSLARALLSAHLHRPPAVARTHRLQPEDSLRPVAPPQRRSVARPRASAQKSGRSPGFAGGASDLDPGSALSSARSLRRARRRALRRWLALGASQRPRLLPAP